MSTVLQYYFPVAFVSLAAKLYLLLAFAPDLGPLQWLEAFVEDVSFHCAVFGGITLALALARHPLARGLVQLGAAALGLVIILFELAAMSMVRNTGVPVDRHLLYYTAENLWMVAPIILSEVNPFWVTSLVGVATAGCILRLRRALGEQTFATPPIPPAVLVCVGLIGVALPPLAAPPGFARAGAVDALAGEWLYPIDRLAPDEPIDPPFQGDGQLTAVQDAAPYDHLVVVALESTGIFATSLLPEGPRTTPYLAQLRDRGVWFPNAYTVMPHSSKAITSILCGVYPVPLMREREAQPSGIPARCLPELLAQQGFVTRYFGAHSETYENRAQQTRNMGFADAITREDLDPTGFEEANYLAFEDDILLDPTSEWLEATDGSRRFAFYLTTTPHHAYDTPSRYPRQEFSADEEQNRYLNSVYYQDRFLDKLIRRYAAAGIASRTLFVIVGDHGEGFGEHGRSKHNSVIYDEGLRVPMLLYAEGIHPERRDAIVSQIDIPATAARFLGYRLEGRDYHGIDLFSRTPSSTVRSMCWYNDRCLARITRSRKIISHLGFGPPEAFVLSTDPHEESNVFGTLPTDSEQLEELQAWKRRLLDRYERSYADRDSVHAASVP